MLRAVPVPDNVIASFQLPARERQEPGRLSVVFAERIPLVELAYEQLEGIVGVFGHWPLRWAGALVSQPPVSRDKGLVMFALYTWLGGEPNLGSRRMRGRVRTWPPRTPVSRRHPGDRSA